MNWYKKAKATLEDVGKADDVNITDKDVDSAELKKGIKIEREHTDSDAMAKEIALDHLAEIPDYYTRLVKMENEAKI